MMAAAPEASSKRQRILIVEDEPFIRLALEAMLPDLGYEVAGSASVVSNALDLIESEQIDCAILDVNLGLQRIDPVADLLAARGCPFVFTTGHGVSGLPSRHAGRPVIEKPFGLEQLEALLRAELEPHADGRPRLKTEAAQLLPERLSGDRRLAGRRPAARRDANVSATKLLRQGMSRGGV
jgi:DNA-binding NtrC family response regulator